MNDTQPYFFYRLVPEGVLLVNTSMGIGDLTPQGIDEALQNLETCARRLGQYGADLVCLGGSPPVVHGGPGAEEEILARLSAAAGLPVTTAQTCAVEALRHLGLRHLAVATPFTAVHNRKLTAFLESRGFQVSEMFGLEREHHEFRRLGSEEVYRAAKETFDRAASGGRRVDGIYLPCAGWPAADAVAPLEEDLGVPVVASAVATVWGCLRALRVSHRDPRYGRLLDLGTTAAAPESLQDGR